MVGAQIAANYPFDRPTTVSLALSLALPVLWIAAMWLAEAYDARFIGTGTDEYRKVLNVGVSLTAAVAIFSYATNLELSRAYVVLALPGITVFDLFARFAMRKRLHRQRARGKCLHNVVAVGHELTVADLVTELGRDRYHGLTAVGACVVRPGEVEELAGVPVYGGLDDITAAVKAFGADTVAVIACPEIGGVGLRTLAWELEKTGTGLCVSPSLLDVTGPRTTIRPIAGLGLLHVGHPQLAGFRGLVKRCEAAAAMVLLAPVMAILTAAMWLRDRGPTIFTRITADKGGRSFRIHTLGTMATDAGRDSTHKPDESRVTPGAAWLLTVVVRLLPHADRERYAEECQSELWELASEVGLGRWQQRRYVLRQFRSAVIMSFALRSPRRRGAAS